MINDNSYLFLRKIFSSSTDSRTTNNLRRNNKCIENIKLLNWMETNHNVIKTSIQRQIEMESLNEVYFDNINRFFYGVRGCSIQKKLFQINILFSSYKKKIKKSEK